jgi:cytochrome c556
MKKVILFVLAGICVLAGTFSACKDQTAEKQACEVKPLNPNGDSELALLMREMTKSTEAMSAALKNGTAFPEKPQGFEKIINAVRTDSTIEQGPYEAYAKGWLGALDRLYAAPEANREEMFNTLVSNCESCHAAYCHGPLERIAKMHVR